MKQTIWVTVHNHKHGVDTYLNESQVGARARVLALILEREPEEMKAEVFATFAKGFDEALDNYNEIEHDTFQVFPQGVGV